MNTVRINVPNQIKLKQPISFQSMQNILNSRQMIRAILDHRDQRLIAIVGPCSFHDPDACLEYAYKLKKLSCEVEEKILIIMRMYLEKPRTALGWKGYINDPYLDGTGCIQEGIEKAREFMIKLCEMNLPIGTEILSHIAYLYYDDLLSWAAIGARTVESAPHRDIASGLTFPLGFKNSTAGDISTAVNGILHAMHSQKYIGMSNDGRPVIIDAKGNPYSHLILRGGKNGPNYSTQDVQLAQNLLASLNLPENIIIDCSHGNSAKNYKKQEGVFNEVISEINNGGDSIRGVMLESFLEAGNQPLTGNIKQLKYGCSITDECISWKTTEMLIKKAYKELKRSSVCFESSINVKASLG